MKILLFLLGLLPLTLAAAAQAPDEGPGKVLYVKHCAPCHGRDGRLGRNGAHNLTQSNLTAFGRTYLVQNGLGKMPAFKKQLSPQAIEQVVLYSLTLK